MPGKSFEFRVSYTRLLIGVLIAVVPISLVALYTISQNSRSFEQAVGERFTTIAQGIATEAAMAIHSHVVEAGLIASDSAIVDQVIQSNRTYASVGEEAITARIERNEARWNTTEGEAVVREMLASRASRTLRRKLQLDPRFLRITVTDEKGATVAATHKTIDYYQADEEYWQNIYASGRGAISLTDILYDEATKSNYVGVGVPIVDENNLFIGTSDALVDVSSIFPIITSIQLGLSGRTMLVKNDGTVIASSAGPTLSMNHQSAEHAALVDASESLRGQSNGHIYTFLSGEGETLIGFADTGLKSDYTNLDWKVIVAQSSADALAPMRNVQRVIMLLVFIALGAVVFLAVYFALHRKDEIEEMEEAIDHFGSATEANPRKVERR